jgi:hypothetical protein
MEKIGFCSSFHNPLPPSFSKKGEEEKKCEKITFSPSKEKRWRRKGNKEEFPTPIPDFLLD